MNSEISNLKSEIATSLPVMEHFYTLQGEGFHQGKAAYFIRLGGCDVGCVWCEVRNIDITTSKAILPVACCEYEPFTIL